MLGSNSPSNEQQKKVSYKVNFNKFSYILNIGIIYSIFTFSTIQVQFIFQRMDTNNDGQITLEEFIEVCTQDTQLAKLLCAGTGKNQDF